MFEKINSFVPPLDRSSARAPDVFIPDSAEPPPFVFDVSNPDTPHATLHLPFASVSDIHLGTHGSRAKRLSKFLDIADIATLKLVGDIVGGTELMEKPTYHFGGPWHKQVLGHFLRKAATGTDVTYIPGNHDYKARGHTIPSPVHGGDAAHRTLTGKTLLGVAVKDKDVYTDPNGLRFGIEHGDGFEDISPVWYNIGDFFHTGLSRIDAAAQDRFPALREHSIAAIIKRAFKTVYMPIMSVKNHISTHLDESGLDGQIYGHSHIGGFETTRNGKMIMNDGCCTEHVQTLVHDAAGTWALLTMYADRFDVLDQHGRAYSKTWDDLGLASAMAELPVLHDDVHLQQVQRLERLIYRSFPSKDRVDALAVLRDTQDIIRDFNLSAADDYGCAHIEELSRLRAAFHHIPIPRTPLGAPLQAANSNDSGVRCANPVDSARAFC